MKGAPREGRGSSVENAGTSLGKLCATRKRRIRKLLPVRALHAPTGIHASYITPPRWADISASR